MMDLQDPVKLFGYIIWDVNGNFSRQNFSIEAFVCVCV